MRLYENEAKQLFRERGIPVPKQYGVIHSASELEGLDAQYPLILKALVLVGGRGKGGGIKKVSYIPCYVNDKAQPEIVTRDDPRGKEVFSYIEKISRSQNLSTNFTWEGGEVVIST